MLLALFLASSCASTDISNRRVMVSEPVPRPGSIWVYDFIANPSEVPTNPSIQGRVSPHDGETIYMVVGDPTPA